MSACFRPGGQGRYCLQPNCPAALEKKILRYIVQAPEQYRITDDDAYQVPGIE